MKYYASFFIAGGQISSFNLPIFEDTQSSGRLGLLEDKEIIKSYALLLAQIAEYEVFKAKSVDIAFMGPVWEIIREIGDFRVLVAPSDQVNSKFRITDDEYWNLIHQPNIYGAMQVVQTKNRQIRRHLQRMIHLTTSLIISLEA